MDTPAQASSGCPRKYATTVELRWFRFPREVITVALRWYCATASQDMHPSTTSVAATRLTTGPPAETTRNLRQPRLGSAA
jgi:hypothetical protein